MRLHTPSEPLWTVEAWRGVAALMVLAAHFAVPAGFDGWWWGFAFTGVDLFFVLSGFVFARYFWTCTRLNLGGYAVRRLLRIYPAYLVSLALMVGMAWLQGKPMLFLAEHVLMAHVQSREMAFYYNPAFWSLPAEMGFYLSLPFLAGWAQQQTRRLLVLGMAALAMRGFLVWAADAAVQNAAYIALHHLPGIAVEFAVGIAAWRVTQNWHPRWGRDSMSARPHRLVLFLCGVCWLGLAILFSRARVEHWGFAIENGITLLSTLLFGLAVAASATPPTHQRSAGRLQKLGPILGKTLGDLSYSVYLLHMAWLAWATYWQPNWGRGWSFASALLGLTVTAWALHRWVEAPARDWGRMLAKKIEAAA